VSFLSIIPLAGSIPAILAVAPVIAGKRKPKTLPFKNIKRPYRPLVKHLTGYLSVEVNLSYVVILWR